MAQNKLEKLITCLQNTVESLVNKVNCLEQKICEQNLLIKKQGDIIGELTLSPTINKITPTTSGTSSALKQPQPVRSARLRAKSAIAAVVDRKKTSFTPKQTATPRTTVETGSDQLASSITPPNVVLEPPLQSLGSGEYANNEWTEVTHRRPRAPRNVVRGMADRGTLEAAERWRYYHLYYVKEGTSETAISEHLQKLCVNEKCSVETLKSRGQYSSFKIGVLSKYSEKVLDGNNWPQDICLKAWRNGFRKQAEPKQD